MPNSAASGTHPGDKAEEYRDTRLWLDQLTKVLTEAVIQVLWTQWSALGGAGTRKRVAHSTIDPEALVLLSLVLSEHERRLGDLTHDWVAVASNLLSTQRLKNLACAYPDSVRAQVTLLAQTALARGKDSRWKTLASISAQDSPLLKSVARNNRMRAVRPSLIEPAALLLRLRQAFGVGIKADTLGFLLGTEGAWATARVISAATGYNISAVRRAADEMSAARVITSASDTATLYKADAVAWGGLLKISQVPAWRSWHERFAFVAAFLDWAGHARERPLTWYALSVKGRDLFEAHKSAFERNHVFPWDDPTRADAWPQIVERGIASLVDWMHREI